MSIKLISSSVLIVMTLSGCAKTYKAMEENDNDIKSNISHVDEVKKQFASKQDAVVVLNDSGVWVSNKSMPAAKDKPAILSEKIAISKGRIGINEISEEITRRLGVSVRLGPEIILSMNGTDANTTASSSSLDTGSNYGSTTQPASPIDKEIYYTSLTFTGTLESLLNVLTARMNVSWDINEHGDLKIYRYITKTFSIAAPHGESEYTTDNATKGVASSESTSSTQSSEDVGTSEISSMISSKQSPWTNVAVAVKSILSTEGRMAVNESAGTITVTDVKMSVDRAGDYVKEQNNHYLRQAAIEITVYNVESNDDMGFGVNWAAIYSKLANYSVAAVSPASLLGSGAGSISAMILDDSAATSSFAGTNALVEALRTQGRVSTVTSGSTLALNHRPSSIRLGLSEGYLKSSSTVTTANVGSTTTLQDGTVQTGSVISLLPNIINAEQLTLQMSINISALIGQIREFKSNGESLFAPKKSIMEINYPVSLKTGQTLVLGGLEDNSASNNKNSMGDSWLAGGSNRSTKKRTSIVIVVKSVIL